MIFTDSLSINNFMVELLDKTNYLYENVLKINLKQDKNIIPIDDITEGNWKLHLLLNRNKLSGLYFYNPLYISQVYSNTPLQLKKEKIEVSINNIESKDNEIKINELSIYDDCFIIEKARNIYVSAFLGKLCGFMLIIK